MGAKERKEHAGGSPRGGAAALAADKGRAVDALTELGFTGNEALTYFELLASPGATAYRLATLTGKSQANVAFALQGLVRKAAVVLNEGEARTYDPLPPAELFEKLRKHSAERIDAAAQRFASIEIGFQGDRICRLDNASEIYDRARRMLERATETVLFESTTRVVEQLEDDLRAAAQRTGMAGLLLNTPDMAIPGARIFMSRNASLLEQSLSEIVLFLVTDAREILIALFSPESSGRRHALWGNNPLLAAVLHNALTSDLLLHSGASIDTIRSPNNEVFGFIPAAITQLYFGDRD